MCCKRPTRPTPVQLCVPTLLNRAVVDQACRDSTCMNVDSLRHAAYQPAALSRRNLLAAGSPTLLALITLTQRESQGSCSETIPHTPSATTVKTPIFRHASRLKTALRLYAVTTCGSSSALQQPAHKVVGDSCRRQQCAD